MMKFQSLFYSMVLVSFFCNCGGKRQVKRFELLTPEETGIDFTNQLTLTDSFNILEFDYLYNGGGVAVGDFNNDGLPDLFFSGNQVSCRLYLNQGDMRFKDITVTSGIGTSQWSEGVAVVDINNDGWLDIYVSASDGGTGKQHQNLLFINQGLNEVEAPYFEEQADTYGIADVGYNTQAAFLDYDLDHDLDLYILSNALETFNRNTTRPKKLNGSGKSTDKLYRNNGDGTFTNVSKAAGILVEGYGLGIAVTDINKDGWPDIYLANDFVTNDILYVNNGDGTFSNQIQQQMRHQSHNGMGADAADYNNDALVDIVVMDMMPETNRRQKSMMVPFASYDRFALNLRMGYEPQYVRNTLQLNKGKDCFSEVGQLAGIFQTDWSWAPIMADLDNDGFRDLYITNGYGKDITDMDYVSYSQSLRSFGTEESQRTELLNEINELSEIRMANYFYKNNGDLTFTDKSSEWGILQPSLSNGAVYVDLDNDGDLDLVVNNINDPAFIYQNTTLSGNTPDSSANYLKIKLKGASQNTLGIGSKITLYDHQGDKVRLQYYEHHLSRGYKSSVDPMVHFGLGSTSVLDSVQVIWPDGKEQVLLLVDVNQLLVMDHQQAILPVSAQKVPNGAEPLFANVTDTLGIDYRHEAEDFGDFRVQPLLPHKHSENGPGIAVGDVNGDALDDFYVGGSPGYPGELFLQSAEGSFETTTLTEEQLSDDMGALLFDADNDGDNDLYIVSGGSRFPNHAAEYLDRFYRNNGSGQLIRDTLAIPHITTSGSVVTAADFDQDGDLDLFVGGRVTPHEYPLPAKSYLLENEQGRFKDITSERCPDFEQLGMVTAALWTDVDQDEYVDLIVTGEWMPIAIYRQVVSSDGNRRFEDITEKAGLANTSGWWNSLHGADFDQDGDIDYVVGNMGLNSRYKASVDEPLSVYTKDFDNNGEIDPIMFYFNQGENYPVHSREALINQIAGLRGRFPNYKTLGETTFERFFREEELEGVYALEAYELRTSYMENLGNGTFKMKALPIEAQFSPVCGIVVEDFNHDQFDDLLLVGNSYDTELVTGRYDAGYGTYLEGDGHGNFVVVPNRESGFQVSGNSKALAKLVGAHENNLYLTSKNRDQLLAFSQIQSSGGARVIRLSPMAQRATVTFKNGDQYHQEFYYGSAYLSQSSRFWQVPEGALSITIFNYKGEVVRKENYEMNEVSMR